MKRRLIILMVILFVMSTMLLIPVLRGCDCQFDAHGLYTAPDGTVYRESTAERNFFAFLLSFLLLITTTLIYINKRRTGNG